MASRLSHTVRRVLDGIRGLGKTLTSVPRARAAGGERSSLLRNASGAACLVGSEPPGAMRCAVVKPAIGGDRRAVSRSHFFRVWVIIPALNEADSIGLVLGDLPHVGRVIVVDNGSTDETAQVAAACGARVVVEMRRGYGSACLRGLQEIETLTAASPKPSTVVFFDADYSDHPELLPNLVRPILHGEADFVLGSRLKGKREPGAMPPQSVWGNRLACVLMKQFFGARFTDLGPFRAIDYASLNRLGMSDQGFGWTIQMQIEAVRVGLRISELPVPYRRRVGTSKISGTLLGTVRAGYRILLTIGKYFVRTCRENRGASA